MKRMKERDAFACVYVCVYTVYDGVKRAPLWLLLFLHAHLVRSPFHLYMANM